MQIYKQIPQHNQFIVKNKLSEQLTQTIIFNSDFDSGNLKSAERIQQNQFYLTTVADGEYSNTEIPQKSWFHFSVQGFNPKQQAKFIIPGITMLFQVSKSPDFFKPVYKTQNGNWRKSPYQVVFLTKENNELELQFDFVFDNDKPIFFAFSFPWTYTENCQFMEQLQQEYSQDSEIYFNCETIIKSPEGRNIDLLTISSQEGQTQELEDYIDPLLFPDRENQQRPSRFRKNKMIVAFTGRVHPGETPASHSMNGIIKFLLSKKDARAQILRKYFVFKIIPLLNPDGVYHGHYRFDIFGQNLNRYYDNPDPNKQPSCYAVRKLIEYLNEDKRVFFYSDLHSHPRKLGCFFYGNAVDDLPQQVESQLYAKIVGMNSINLEYENCNFSKKHMNAKDRNEDVTKQSCARVQVQKITGIIHCYTLENGYHQNNFISELPYPTSTHRRFGTYGYTEPDAENFQSDLYKRGPPSYNIQIYEQIGRAMLISILDVFDKNPYSRLPSSNYKNIDTLRRDLAVQVARQDRFKKDDSVPSKIKNITNLIKEQFFKQFKEKKVFDLSERGNQQKRFTISKGKSNIQKIKSAKQIKQQQNQENIFQQYHQQNDLAFDKPKKINKPTKMPKINKKFSKNQDKNTDQNKNNEVLQLDKFQKNQLQSLKNKQSQNIPPRYSFKIKLHQNNEVFKELDHNNNKNQVQINLVNGVQQNKMNQIAQINNNKSPKQVEYDLQQNTSMHQNHNNDSNKQFQEEITNYHRGIYNQNQENMENSIGNYLQNQDMENNIKQQVLILKNINRQNPYSYGNSYAQQKIMMKFKQQNNFNQNKLNNPTSRQILNKTEQQEFNNDILELENLYNNEINSNITKKIMDLEYGVDIDPGYGKIKINGLNSGQNQRRNKKYTYQKSNSQQKRRNHEYLLPIQINQKNNNLNSNQSNYIKQNSAHESQNKNSNSNGNFENVDNTSSYFQIHNNGNKYTHNYNFNKNKII